MRPRAGFAAATAAVLSIGLPAVPAVAAADLQAVTVVVDPSYQQQEFQGWGTSLAWLAEVTGGYPAEIRNQLVDMLFGADGLNLNIARYNIGGGNAPTVKDYLRPGGAVPGWWQAPSAATGPADKSWWDPADPADWNFAADPNQRWWLDQIKDKVTHWEAFSNSPPYFQTVSGYVSGGFSSTSDQIRTDTLPQFAEYLVRVTEHLESTYGIRFDSIDPLNEPNTNYWGTTLGSNGQPTGGRQEGAHAGPALQAQVVQALKARLATATTKAVVSAPDETNPGTLVTDWYNYPAAGQAAVSRINVHTYGTGQRTSVRDIAKAEQKSLWMSEVEGSWGHDYTSMDSGLGMAQRIIDDFRELEPSAWVLWQPVEDAKNMVAEGNLQWGEIHVPFDCTATDTLQTCPIKTNTKYDTIRNFTHYVRPGDHVVRTDDTASLAAIGKDGKSATVVHTNAGTTAQAVTLDLSKFGTIGPKATVTPVVTSAAGKLVTGTAVKVSGGRATLTVPAQSVVTFLVKDVSGAAAHLRSGHTYRLEGVSSRKSLATDATIRTSDPARADEQWTLTALGTGLSSTERYEVTSAASGKRLAVRSGALVLEAPGTTDEAAQWVLSTTGDGTYTFINAGARRLLDVGGSATADGSPVGVYQPNSNGNQRWTLVDETIAKTTPVITYTVPGLVPALPATVGAVTYGGLARSLPVTWTMPPTRAWRKPGLVTVTGTATDIHGHTVPATAQVTVDTFTSTLPGRAKTYPGGTPALPATVVGVGRNEGRADLPVAWSAAPAGAFDNLGVVTLTGTATAVDGTQLPAAVRVQIATPTSANVATEPGVAVGATFTEGGYSTTGLVNGVTTDKAWSNWKSSGRNAADTLTVTLPAARDVTGLVVHFYADNSSGGGLAQSVQAGIPNAAGTCVPAGDVVTVGTSSPLAVTVPLPATRTATVCLVLTTVPNGYLTVAELEVLAKAPGVGTSADLAEIRVDGKPIPVQATSSAKVSDPARATITATTVDPYATAVVTRISPTRVDITVTSEDGATTKVYRVNLVCSRR